MGLPLLSRTSTTTETDPPPGPDSDLADLPAFAPPPMPLPSLRNPDAPPPGADPGEAAPAGDSKQQKASIQGFFKQRAKSYAKIAETLLKGVGGMLHAAADLGEDSDAFLPDEDDLETIPPPLGRLAARRIRIGADPDTLTDVEDIGMAAVGILVWLAKGVGGVLETRRIRRRAEQDRAVHREPGDGQ